MRSTLSRMRFPLIAVALATVSACNGTASTQAVFPSASDLTVKPRPVADPAGLTSEAALDRYETDLFLWGEEGWLAVGRLCRFHQTLGMKIRCPPPDEPLE
jgi:hypothetical protein